MVHGVHPTDRGTVRCRVRLRTGNGACRSGRCPRTKRARLFAHACAPTRIDAPVGADLIRDHLIYPIALEKRSYKNRNSRVRFTHQSARYVGCVLRTGNGAQSAPYGPRHRQMQGAFYAPEIDHCRSGRCPRTKRARLFAHACAPTRIDAPVGADLIRDHLIYPIALEKRSYKNRNGRVRFTHQSARYVGCVLRTGNGAQSAPY